MSTPGIIYFIGEKDLRTGTITSYYKVGIVRENQKNLERDADERLSEHQTGNPRELFVEHTISTPFAEKIETLVHKKFASWGVRGEWMSLSSAELEEVKVATMAFASEAVEIAKEEERATQIADMPSTDSVLKPTEEILAIHLRYLQESSKLKSCEEMRQSLRELIKVAHIEEPESVEEFAQVREQKGRSKFDEEGFKAKYPEIYQRFIERKRTIKARFLVSTPKDLETNLHDFDKSFSEFVVLFNDALKEIQETDLDKRQYHDLNLTVLRFSAEAEWEKLKAEVKLKIACGSSKEIEGVLKWSREEVFKESLEKKALKEQYPNEVEEFTTVGAPIQAVIVDPKKGYN